MKPSEKSENAKLHFEEEFWETQFLFLPPGIVGKKGDQSAQCSRMLETTKKKRKSTQNEIQN